MASKESTISLVFGILSIVFGLPILGIIFGIVAIIYSKKSPDEGVAKAGLITGIIGIVLNVITTLVVGIIVVIAILAYNGELAEADYAAQDRSCESYGDAICLPSCYDDQAIESGYTISVPGTLCPENTRCCLKSN